MKNIEYNINITNKQILKMYYSQNVRYLNVCQIKKMFGCEYKKASTIRDSIKKELYQSGIDTPVGLVPFDEVLKVANLNINIVERNYKKEVRLGL